MAFNSYKEDEQSVEKNKLQTLKGHADEKLDCVMPDML